MQIKRELIRILQSKTSRNGIWLYAAQFFNLVCPLITIPYITRILGPEINGYFSIALNFVGYLQVLVEYGFMMSATRKIAQCDDRDYTCKLYSCVILGRFLLFSISVLILIVYVLINSNSILLRRCVLILVLYLLGYCFQVNWLFQGKQEMQFTALIGMISRVLSVGLIFGIVKESADIYRYCFLYSFLPLIGSLFSNTLARKRYGISIVRVSFKEILEELKDGWHVFTTQLSSKVFTAISVTFLGIYCTAYEAGIYDALRKIPYVLTVIWMPISQVIYPVISKRFSCSFQSGCSVIKRVAVIVIPLFSFFVFLICVFAKPIASLFFGEEYSTYYYWMYPQLVWVILGIANNLLGIQALLGSGHDKEYAICFYVGVIANVSLNALFVYFWGGLGASIAPLCSELILFVLLFVSLKKTIKKEGKNNSQPES